MIIVMRAGAPEAQVEHVQERIAEVGLTPHMIVGTERTVIAVIGDERVTTLDHFSVLPGVEKVMPVLAPYKLASREGQRERSSISVGGVPVGGVKIPVIAGPCSVEDRQQIVETALAVKEAGATLLRGGAFKPRTSPYAFQGLQGKGLDYLAEARERSGLPIVTEVVTPEDVAQVGEVADCLQVGARNMQNYLLLREVGRAQKPVLLKRGMSATIDELLLAAEYVLKEGNPAVLLCERGVRTFERHTRNTLPLATVPALQERSHLPVVVDPSHGTGRSSLVTAMSRAAVAAGCDALMIEVHHDPETAVSDGDQSLDFAQFAEMMKQIRRVAAAVDREV